ncbi:MAG: hypothetical protein V4622_06435, partial [Bacteroidota bacterium]
MKKILLIILCLITIKSFGQNFSLINKNLINNYQILNTTIFPIDTIIYSIKVEDITISNSDTV